VLIYKFIFEDIKMYEITFGITIILFLATSVFSIISLHSDDAKYFLRSKILFLSALAAFILTGIIKYNPTSVDSLVKLTRTIWGYFYMISLLLMLTLLYLNFSRWKNQMKPITAISVPFITILLVISIPFIESGRRIETVMENSLLPVHIFITTLGELFFFFSFTGSILYLIMEWQLRKKSSMKFIFRLPNLETIKNFNRWAVSRSLILLTLGLLLGIIMLLEKFNAPFMASPKEITIYGSWAVILGIFLLRYKTRMSSHNISLINVILFVLIMCMYIFTTIFFTSGFHSYR